MNERTECDMVELNERTGDRCFGCGDFRDLCQTAEHCGQVLEWHGDGFHDACDILVCAAADSAAHNMGWIR